MYADAAFEFCGFSPGYLTNEIVTAYGHSFGHFELQQIGTGAAESIPSCFSSDLTDSGALVGANIVQSSVVSDYDLGGEGDLFKAPEPIIEEPIMGLDPVTASAISIMSNSDDIIADLNVSSIQSEQLLNDMFYECKTIEESQSLSELLDVKIPPMEKVVEVPVEGAVRKCAEDEGVIQKSISSGCLNSMDWVHGCSVRPNFLDFHGLDFETAFGLRRAFSEGDIQNLGSNGMRLATNVQSSFERFLTISDLKSEERKQKLSRYRKKKIKRNFGRKIKYACRKALADSQPRVRGRFAKMEECEIPRPRK